MLIFKKKPVDLKSMWVIQVQNISTTMYEKNVDQLSVIK